MDYLGRYATPIGVITVRATSYAVTGVSLSDRGETESPSPLTDRAAEQICEYLDGSRRVFDVPVFADGTPFQMKIWEQAGEIPYGSTLSYTDAARAAHRPDAVRATAAACRANPCMILIPTHRIVSKNGGQTADADGTLTLAQTLLALERKATENETGKHGS